MGAVVISIDAELAWGFHDQPTVPESRLAGAREAWEDTLELLDRYGLPATWAIVGHLMLDACDGEHADHPAPPGWFARDPGGNADEAGRWMAPGLVRAILEADADHEIGSHTFSHLDLDGPATTARMIDAELDRHRALGREWGLDLRAFVFPGNRVAARDRLAEAGFRCYRGATSPRWYRGKRLRRSKKALDFLFGPAEPPVVRPSHDEHGLVNIPATLHLFGFEGPPGDIARSLGKDPVVAAAAEGIDAAAEGEGVFHVWFHPNNMTTPGHRDRLNAVLELIDESEAPVRTMTGVADRVRPSTYA